MKGRRDTHRLHRQLVERRLQRALDAHEEGHGRRHVGEERRGDNGDEDVVPGEGTAR